MNTTIMMNRRANDDESSDMRSLSIENSMQKVGLFFQPLNFELDGWKSLRLVFSGWFTVTHR